MKKSVSAPLGEGMGEEILRRARPALDATAVRRLSAALSKENPTVYQAVNVVTSTARGPGVTPRLLLETLAGGMLMTARNGTDADPRLPKPQVGQFRAQSDSGESGILVPPER